MQPQINPYRQVQYLTHIMNPLKQKVKFKFVTVKCVTVISVRPNDKKKICGATRNIEC